MAQAQSAPLRTSAGGKIAALLEKGLLRERSISRRRLSTCPACFVINAIKSHPNYLSLLIKHLMGDLHGFFTRCTISFVNAFYLFPCVGCPHQGWCDKAIFRNILFRFYFIFMSVSM